MRIGSHCVFDLPTKELRHGEESEEGKEEESEKEEVILRFDVSARRNFECDACVRRLDTSSRHFFAAAFSLQPPFVCATCISNGETGRPDFRAGVVVGKAVYDPNRSFAAAHERRLNKIGLESADVFDATTLRLWQPLPAEP